MKIMIATFFLIFLKAIQQQNVVGGHYWPAFLTSYALALVEVLVIYWIAKTGLDAVLWVGTGAAFGCITAMFLHKKLIKVKDGKNPDI